MRLTIVPVLLASFLAACASGDDGAGPNELAGGKADDATCTGAALDAHGICRFENGRFAPARCCTIRFVDECFIFEDHATDVCLPDDDAPADWPTCFEISDVTPDFAAGCCELIGADQLLWCDSVSVCSSGVSSPVGDDIEDVAEAQVGSIFLTADNLADASETEAAQVVAAVQRLGLVGPGADLAAAVDASDDGIAVVDLEFEGDEFLAADWISLRAGGVERGVVFADGATQPLAEVRGFQVFGCR
jgi:hypothetical protein